MKLLREVMLQLGRPLGEVLERLLPLRNRRHLVIGEAVAVALDGCQVGAPLVPGDGAALVGVHVLERPAPLDLGDRAPLLHLLRFESSAYLYEATRFHSSA